MSNKKTKFFFIDEQGTLSNNHDWLLRGGYLIDVNDYLILNKEIKKINFDFLSEHREVKWSDISNAIYLKRNNKVLNNDIFYLNDFTIDKLEEYLNTIFSKISDFDIQIIFNISKKDELLKFVKRQDSFIKMQLQNLMQRCQFAGQEGGFVTIIVHENENTVKDDKIKKDVYKQIISEDSFIKDYNLVVDNLFIEFSNLNIGIQVADFIIGVLSSTARDYKTSKEIYSKYLKDKVRKNTKDDSIIGFGVVTIPNPKSSTEFASKMSEVFS